MLTNLLLPRVVAAQGGRPPSRRCGEDRAVVRRALPLPVSDRRALALALRAPVHLRALALVRPPRAPARRALALAPRVAVRLRAADARPVATLAIARPVVTDRRLPGPSIRATRST